MPVSKNTQILPEPQCVILYDGTENNKITIQTKQQQIKGNKQK